ncbi:D-hexose-6-phosphate mutarotase [Deefgea tanakiae]|uniref:Putative glucose-6-phosphate 1-epimerase n=1 Tax=Deefgea tanakiae TaxID=2865840 RepID=A0ABX8Z1U9_9NEIS|nr:D-hexose-6-phosphate mutarotase [Deefgea tanakiae]QZA76537.1 D-hexose-6-phosphate mutarotase [Deefgea tanakiae]
MTQQDFSTVLANVNGVRLTTSSAHFNLAGDGLPLLVVENALGSAAIVIQGAHLVSFIPTGGQDLLWLSPNAIFEPTKAVRGGIPLCMPWFGGHPDGLPSHGFARSTDWTLQSARNLADGRTEIVMSLQDTEQTRSLWPHAFKFEFTILVGTVLELSMNTQNLSDTSVPYTYAFHTYFAVSDYTQVAVSGLADLNYIDTIGVERRLVQEGDVVFTGSTDRVYLDVPEVQTIIDGTRTIRISSCAQSAVVWNPGEHAKNIADIGGDAYQHFVCVERGDVFDNALTLAAGASHTATMTLSA